MTDSRSRVLLFCLGALLASTAQAQGEVPAGLPAAAAAMPEARSGYHYQSEEIRALQDDDFANPAMLWVDRGKALWREAGSGEQGDEGEHSCAGCHGEPSSLRGAAVTYPKVDETTGHLLNLEGRINQCRTERQGLEGLAYESEEMLALTALVSHQSRGLPIDVSIDGPAKAYFDEGQRYFYTRRGQMNLACHHCHQLNAGRYLRGDRLSQGQPTGYPIYRLDWQTLGSLHRRLRFCNTGVRAEPFPFGDPTYVSLELFLAWRARGLPWEAPAVRR